MLKKYFALLAASDQRYVEKRVDRDVTAVNTTIVTEPRLVLQIGSGIRMRTETQNYNGNYLEANHLRKEHRLQQRHLRSEEKLANKIRRKELKWASQEEQKRINDIKQEQALAASNIMHERQAMTTSSQTGLVNKMKITETREIDQQRQMYITPPAVTMQLPSIPAPPPAPPVTYTKTVKTTTTATPVLMPVAGTTATRTVNVNEIPDREYVATPTTTTTSSYVPAAGQTTVVRREVDRVYAQQPTATSYTTTTSSTPTTTYTTPSSTYTTASGAPVSIDTSSYYRPSSSTTTFVTGSAGDAAMTSPAPPTVSAY